MAECANLKNFHALFHRVNPFKEAEEEVPALEPQPDASPAATIKRSAGGRTFRRRAASEISESMTPADAILQSAPVNPDLDKALLLVKGIA